MSFLDGLVYGFVFGFTAAVICAWCWNRKEVAYWRDCYFLEEATHHQTRQELTRKRKEDSLNR